MAAAAAILSVLSAVPSVLPVMADEPDYDIISFGTWEQDGDPENGPEPIEWYVAEETEDAFFYISRYVLDNVPYNDSDEDVGWTDSYIRSWLNHDFLTSAFSTDEQAVIQETVISNDANPDHGTGRESDTTDRIFLLDVQESSRYFPTADERKGTPTASLLEEDILTLHDNCLWRLRTTGRTQKHAVVVLSTGEYDYCGLNDTYTLAGLRPAMWVAK